MEKNNNLGSNNSIGELENVKYVICGDAISLVLDNISVTAGLYSTCSNTGFLTFRHLFIGLKGTHIESYKCVHVQTWLIISI